MSGALLFALTACASAPSATWEKPAGDLLLKADGFGIAGSGQEIGFGRARDGAVTAAAKLLGRPPKGTGLCGGGVLATTVWSNGLSMVFRNGDFLGWYSTAETLPTATGLAAGMPRDSVGALPGARLSSETFDVGGISGRFGPSGTVAALWAGEVCP